MPKLFFGIEVTLAKMLVGGSRDCQKKAPESHKEGLMSNLYTFNSLTCQLLSLCRVRVPGYGPDRKLGSGPLVAQDCFHY